MEFSVLFRPQNFNSIAQMAFRVLVNHHHRYVVDKNRVQADSGTIRAIQSLPQTGTHEGTPASTTLLVLSLLLTLISKTSVVSSWPCQERKPDFFRVFLKSVLRF